MFRTIVLTGLRPCLPPPRSRLRRRRARRSAISFPIPRRARQAAFHAVISRHLMMKRMCRNYRRVACCQHPIVRGQDRACRRPGWCSHNLCRRRPARQLFLKTPRRELGLRPHSLIKALRWHRRPPIRCRDCRRDSASPRVCRNPLPHYSLAMRWLPSRRRRRSSTRRQAFQVLIRSLGVSLILTRISAKPSSSARCGSRPTLVTLVRRRKPLTPTPLSRSTKSHCRAR